MRILFLSHTAELGPFRVGSHHLTRELALSGHRVAHVSTPLSAAHLALAATDPMIRARCLMAFGANEPRPGQVVHIVPLQPLPAGPFARLHPARFWYPWKRQVLRALGGEPHVIVLDQSSFIGALQLFPDVPVVFRATDLPRTERERTRFASLARDADALVATSEPLLDHLLSGPHGSGPTLVLPNGVDLEHFEARPVEWARRAGFVYVGAIDERFDWNWVERLARELPAERIELWGPPSRDLPRDLPQNVSMRGTIDYAALPDLLSQFRVGLMPFTDSDLNRGRSPMKLYEYLAAGLHVMASAPGPAGLPVGSSTSLAAPGDVGAVGADALTSRAGRDGRRIAEQQSWASRARSLETLLLSLRHTEK